MNNIPPNFGSQGVPPNEIGGISKAGIPQSPKSSAIQSLGNEISVGVNMPKLLESLAHETFKGCPNALMGKTALIGLFNNLYNAD